MKIMIPKIWNETANEEKEERTVIGPAKKNMSQCKQDYGVTLETNRFSETNPKHRR